MISNGKKQISHTKNKFIPIKEIILLNLKMLVSF